MKMPKNALNIFVGFMICLTFIYYIQYTKESKINKQPYVVLQTEEPLSINDTLQVLDISNDTIFIGYLH